MQCLQDLLILSDMHYLHIVQTLRVLLNPQILHVNTDLYWFMIS